jgi:hypothetical protein
MIGLASLQNKMATNQCLFISLLRSVVDVNGACWREFLGVDRRRQGIMGSPPDAMWFLTFCVALACRLKFLPVPLGRTMRRIHGACQIVGNVL